MKKMLVILAMIGLFTLSACQPAGVASDEPIPVRLMLDWVPNVNHAGIFVADARGFFADNGLAVEIIQPGEVYPEAAVVSGEVEFGISFQEYVALSRAEGLPLVSVAAIMQHNTSGFASPASLGVETAADFEGLTYGSFGSPFEEPILRGLMACAGGDYDDLQVVNTGYSDPLLLLDRGEIDLAWIFYGVQGVTAAVRGIDLDIIMLSDHFDCIPDYYTPVVIASEEMTATRPEVVRAFVNALSAGYQYAADNPAETAGILLEAVPELDPRVVEAGMAWMAPRYQDDAPRWGEQRLEIWQAYVDWLLANDIIAEPIDPGAAFTNAFLP